MPEKDLPQNASPNGEEEKDVPSIPELDRYIFTLDEYQAGIVPRKLEPDRVARYLIGRIKRDLQFKSFLRVESVADFYDTNEVVAKYKQFLDRSESSEEDIRRSAAIARIIARLGTEADREFAGQYYKYLIQRAETVPVFEDLILLHEALGLGGGSADLRAKLDSIAKGLAQKKDSDYRARLEHRQYTGPLLQKLDRAEKVEAVKMKIIGIRERKDRIKEEIKAYLTVDYGYLEYLQPWAARRLRRETWAESPAEQTKRNDQRPLEADVVASMRAYLKDPVLSPDAKPEGNESLQLRLLRAIKFFNGELTEQEVQFLADNRDQQSDILSNEGFMLPK